MIIGFVCKGVGCSGEVVHSSLLRVELSGKQHDEVFSTISDYHLCSSCAEHLVFTYQGQEDFKVKVTEWKTVIAPTSRLGRR